MACYLALTLRPVTRQSLLDISTRFYERHGASFDATRGHPWPGWDRLWQLVSSSRAPDRRLACFDAGCGNGRFGRFLRERHRGLRYVGVDLDEGLLDAARRELDGIPGVSLHRLDLAEDDPGRVVPARSQDLVVLVGVLHHVPDEAVRRRLLRRLAGLVAPGGILVASFWRLDRDETRFGRKRVPWERWNAGQPAERRIDASDLDPGDVLLRWRGDETVPRYCHFPDEAEIARLSSAAADLELIETFEADGPTGRDNLYLVWRRANLPAP